MNQYLRRLSNQQQYGEDQSSAAASAGLGLLLGAGFLIFLPILLKEAEKDFQKAAGSSNKDILTPSELKSFFEWIDDGNAFQLKNGMWVEQTTQYRVLFTFNNLKRFFKKEYLRNN